MDLSTQIKPVKLFSMSYTPDGYQESYSRPPVIFLHGLMASPYAFNRVKRKISEITKRKVYAIAMRNHGKSGWTKEFTLNHQLLDIENFMATENISKAVLVGHSFGGRIVLAFALRNPNMVEKLVIEDMNVHDQDHFDAFKRTTKSLREVYNSISNLGPGMSEAEVQKKFSSIVTDSWQKNTGRKYRPVIPFMVPMHKDKSGKFVWDVNVDVVFYGDSYVDDYNLDFSTNPIFNGETLFIEPELSNISMERNKDLISKHFPNSTIFIAENIDHIYHLEAPEDYVEVVSNFLRQ